MSLHAKVAFHAEQAVKLVKHQFCAAIFVYVLLKQFGILKKTTALSNSTTTALLNSAAL